MLRPAAFFFGGRCSVHLLYLDDSGSVKNASDRHVILAGLAVFERQPHWLSQKLDELAEELWPDNPIGLEFHGSEMYSGRRHWRGIKRDVRINSLLRALTILAESRHVCLFGAAVHKAAISPHDPTEYGFEQLCNRFDLFLGRLHRRGDTQRGLIILDKSSYETSLQGLARDFRGEGHRWGQLHNLTDVPLFVDSQATRMIQYADLIAYSMRRYYENGESRLFDLIAGKFDSEGGVVHGLVHFTPSGENCNCLSCRQRRTY